jgi:polyphenol oxidase
MIWIGNMSEPELRFALPGGAQALFTTRENGNLSSVGGPDHELGLQARERLREQIGASSLIRGYQVHGTAVSRVRTAPSAEPPQEDLVPADGQATITTGLGAMVLSADCLPVALATTAAVAAIHAGWRGLAAGVLEEGVHAVRELGGESGITAIIGPGAGPCCYEVGEEVHEAFGEKGRGTSNIDLKAIARDKLLAAGVSEVHDLAVCTICDERFFSHRREGALAGRQGVVVWRS